MTVQADLGKARAGALRACVPHLLAAALVGVATGMSMQLLNLRLHDLGASNSLIGASAAVQAAGIVCAAPLTRVLLAKLGVRAVLVLGSAVSVPIFLAFGIVEELWAWHLLRFAFAFGVALLFTVSEYIVVSRSRNGRRGDIIGW